LEVEQVATRALRYLATPEIAASGKPAGILLADWYVNQTPKFVTIVGGKKDVQAQELFQAALRSASDHQRIEWWDPSAGRGLRTGIAYPSAPAQAAAFLCNRTECSAAITNPTQLATQLVSAQGTAKR
jgi:uncharacterized protein YyaL (SSP411 family)